MHFNHPKGRFLPRAIATDCDGTLLTGGRLNGAVLEALQSLRQRGIPLILVTGRAAGFAWTLFETLGAQAVVAENGGLLFEREAPERALTLPPWDAQEPKSAPPALQTLGDRPSGGWSKGRKIFESLQRQGLVSASLRPTLDVAFRITDFTFPVEGLTREELRTIAKATWASGADFVSSTIHAHIMPRGQSKARTLLALLRYWGIDPEMTVTLGDSPNDESLFDPALFPWSYGVANIAQFENDLRYLPAKRTRHEEGWGFAEAIFDLIGQPEAFARVFVQEKSWSKIAFIDAECGLCSRLAQSIQRLDKGQHWHLSSQNGLTAKLLFGDPARIPGFEPDALLTWSEGELSGGAKALQRLAADLGPVARRASALFTLLPASLQRFLYSLVAKNRYRIWGRVSEKSFCEMMIGSRVLP